MNRSARLSIVLGAIALATACGPGKKEPQIAPLPSASAASPAASAAASGSAAWVVTAPPSGLPPFAVVPPPGVRGSKKAKKKDVAGLDACVPWKTSTKDVVAELERIAQACAKASPMKAAGPVLRGTQGDGEPAARHKAHVDGGRCYRVYLAHDARSAVIGLRDGAGDLVAESPTFAAPETGVACFASADDVEIVVSIGGGKGAYAAQLYAE